MLSNILAMTTEITKLTLAPANNRFHGTGIPGAKATSEKGERLEDNGNGTASLYINGKFIAIVSN